MKDDRPLPEAAVLYSRRECPLCFALHRVAARAARRHRVPLVVRDVDADPRLKSLYDSQVPVLIMPGGETRSGRVSAADVEEVFRRAGRDR